MSGLYDEVLLDHAKHPRNFGPLPGATAAAQGENPLCGDDITVRARIDGGRIAEIACEGAGCAVCLGSASLMTVAVKSLPVADARGLSQRVRAMLDGGGAEGLGDLAALAGVARHPARVRCAALPWEALGQVL